MTTKPRAKMDHCVKRTLRRIKERRTNVGESVWFSWQSPRGVVVSSQASNWQMVCWI